MLLEFFYFLVFHLTPFAVSVPSQILVPCHPPYLEIWQCPRAPSLTCEPFFSRSLVMSTHHDGLQHFQLKCCVGFFPWLPRQATNSVSSFGRPMGPSRPSECLNSPFVPILILKHTLSPFFQPNQTGNDSPCCLSSYLNSSYPCAIGRRSSGFLATLNRQPWSEGGIAPITEERGFKKNLCWMDHRVNFLQK